jgi:CubicO group peptidase (beta-lactamase class C family)
MSNTCFAYFCALKNNRLKYLLYISIFFAFAACKENSSATAKKNNIPDIDKNYRKLTDHEKSFYAERLQKMADSLLGRNFNGSMLVAKNGQVLIEQYKGYSDLQKKDTIKPNTPFHIASISKTFTGMAVLKLWEQDKLSLEDSLQKFFPGFPYPGITVRMLLNHRSGLANYAYFMPADTAWWWKKKHFATNNDMLEFMMVHKPAIYSYPNRSFHYCNTNFALLALIVEKVTGQSFPEYMKENLFQPLGMQNTFVFSIKDTASYKPSYNYNNSIFPIENMDCIYGDKNVYSTPRDLMLWDKALFSNSFVSKGTYEEATKPYSLEKPSVHNYGLGFRLMIFPDHKVVYHNGWWHGNNGVFSRMVADTAVVIVLGNKYNREIYRGFKMGTAFGRSIDITKTIQETGP